MAGKEQDVVKATDIVALKKMFREEATATETLFLQQLSPAARNLYKTIHPHSKISQTMESQILAAGARLLFPNHPKPLRELTRQLAHKTMATIYKIFLRIPSLHFLARQIPYLWRMFFSRGVCEIADHKEKSITILIKEIPDLIFNQREEICGSIIGILEMAGGRNVQIQNDDTNPNAWKWDVTWD